jgi:hypothetical protein
MAQSVKRFQDSLHLILSATRFICPNNSLQHSMLGEMRGESVSPTDQMPIPLDPIEWLRAHPEMFFKSGTFEVDTIIGLLVREAVNSERVTATWTLEVDGWVAVGADADWLDGNVEAFAKPTHFPEGGQNATRVESLLTTFCDAVFTSSRGNRDDVRALGRSHMPPTIARYLANPDVPRVVVFRSPSRTQLRYKLTPQQMSPWLELAIRSMPHRDREFVNA